MSRLSSLTTTIRLIAMAVLALGSAGAAEKLPPAPPSYVLDEARLLNADQLLALTSQLQASATKTGVAVYVTAFTIMARDNTNLQARALVTSWCGDRPGVVITHHRGSKQWSVAVSPEMWRRYPANEVTTLLDMITRQLSIEQTSDQKLGSAASTAVGQVAQMEAGRIERQGLFTRQDFTVAAAFCSLLAALGLGVLLFNAWSRKRQRIVHEFPDVEVGQRLGAQYGGGAIIEMNATGGA